MWKEKNGDLTVETSAKHYLKQMINVCVSNTKFSWFYMLPSPTLLCLPHSRSVSQGTVLRERIMTLQGKPTNGEDGRLISQNNPLISIWVPISFIEQRGGGGEEVHKSCKYLLEWPVLGGEVLVSSLW